MRLGKGRPLVDEPLNADDWRAVALAYRGFLATVEAVAQEARVRKQQAEKNVQIDLVTDANGEYTVITILVDQVEVARAYNVQTATIIAEALGEHYKAGGA